jgi:hypothetical protein
MLVRKWALSNCEAREQRHEFTPSWVKKNSQGNREQGTGNSDKKRELLNGEQGMGNGE